MIHDALRYTGTLWCAKSRSHFILFLHFIYIYICSHICHDKTDILFDFCSDSCALVCTYVSQFTPDILSNHDFDPPAGLPLLATRPTRSEMRRPSNSSVFGLELHRSCWRNIGYPPILELDEDDDGEICRYPP